MRTTVDVDTDVLQAARSLARSQRRSLGRVLSDLARRGLAPRREDSRRGFPVFQVSPDAPPLTSETVARALDDEV
ncbi:MAG TPA: antitoxin [Vicinamibacteria bacterium]|nr:antitoxin [Vicinamibacteria bacterium]